MLHWPSNLSWNWKRFRGAPFRRFRGQHVPFPQSRGDSTTQASTSSSSYRDDPEHLGLRDQSDHAEQVYHLGEELGVTASRVRLTGKSRSRLGFLRRRNTPYRYINGIMITALAILLCVGYVTLRFRRETQLLMRWTPDAEIQAFMQRPLPPPSEHTSVLNYQLPLHTRGNKIVDATGRRFKLLSVNWYGASDELFVPGGLDVRNRSDIARTIRKMGFNSVRLPYSDELVIRNPRIEDKLLAANRDLQGLRAMDILEAVTNALTDEGLAVIMNNHITSATRCCGPDPCDAAWANDYLRGFCRVKQTEKEWIKHWEAVMYRHKDNPLVIGADLRNQVRGLWGTMPWRRWAEAAERCGNHLLEINPNWLMIVEGTESANDLSGARDRPVEFQVPDRLVYSAHVYAWSGWGSPGGRFKQREYDSFSKAMSHNWGYLLEGDEAPVWIGEIGASMFPTIGDATYWKNLWRYLKERDVDFGYWAINPRKPHSNERETYSILGDDWQTPITDYRLKKMVEVMSP